MADDTQEILDALISEARARVPHPKAAKFEADIKARSHNSVSTQISFVRRVIDAFDDTDVSEYSPVGSSGSGDGIKKPSPTNPWSRAGWNATAQSKLVAAIGVEKAAAISASAGCKIGDTKPNPAYN